MVEAAMQSAAGREYRYRHVTAKVFYDDMGFSQGSPGPGDSFPDLELASTDGTRYNLSDFTGDRPALIITGSFTCPMTASSNPVLKRLHDEFGARVRFVMVHVREAHPGEKWDQPESFGEKVDHARALKHRDRLPWLVLVDDEDGSLHRALDEKPNSAYLVDRDGRIVFRSLWAGDEKGLWGALHSVAHGEIPSERESTRRLAPMAMGIGMMQEMVRQAGPRAKADLWRAAPPMALMAVLADLFRPLPPMWRAAAAAGSLALVGAAVVLIATRPRASAARQNRR
jgi:hypothetical protein